MIHGMVHPVEDKKGKDIIGNVLITESIYIYIYIYIIYMYISIYL